MFYSYKPKEWKVKVMVLEKLLREAGVRYSRISRADVHKIVVEGGTIPMMYDAFTKELVVWSKGSRNAGGSITIAQLQIAEAALQRWQEEYL